MFQTIPMWLVTFKPCKEIPDVTLRVSERNLEGMLTTLRMSQCDNLRFEREGSTPQIPDPPDLHSGVI